MLLRQAARETREGESRVHAPDWIAPSRGITDSAHEFTREQLNAATRRQRLHASDDSNSTDRNESGDFMIREMKNILRAPAAVLVFGAAIGLSVPAISLAGGKPATAVVQVNDLNLATASGMRALENRTAAAIEKVCPLRGSIAGPRSNSYTAHRECAQSVRFSVQQQIRERGGRPVAGT
jgi:UrcA family protein